MMMHSFLGNNRLILAALLMSCSSLVWAQDKLVPIVIELPKPMFIGTPQNLRVPNLEKPHVPGLLLEDELRFRRLRPSSEVAHGPLLNLS